MFAIPITLPTYNLLREKDVINEIYRAMNSDDYADVVMAAMDAHEKCKSFPNVRKVHKCESLSDKYRNEGNIAYEKGNMIKALECYNIALMYAPNNSNAMKLAYSNRSAVFYNHGQFNACKEDIERCFQLGCPSNIIKKLTKRLETIKNSCDIETTTQKEFKKDLSNIFKFDAKPNTQIPCASANIEVIRKDSSVKIVTAKDVKVGTLLAVEPPFVSWNYNKSTAIYCHYCHKMTLNLIPCDRCCFALFCNEECKKLCQKDFHSIECQIMEVLTTCVHPIVKLVTKSVLKFVQMCESWQEVITTSQCTGSRRINTSTTQEMFDVGNKVSMLCYNDDKLFIYGNMYNTSFTFAMIIYYLEKVPSFFPKLLGERKTAKQALGRLLMYFMLHPEPTRLRLNISSRIFSNTYEIRGYFPFIGKLQKSCKPNAFVLKLNKTIALIALQPIKKGTELTVSYLGNYQKIRDIDLHVKNWTIFETTGKVCKCYICNGDWKLLNANSVLTERQRSVYINKFLPLLKKEYIIINLTMTILFEVLTCLNDVPFSEEYQNVCTFFYKCVTFYENYASQFAVDCN